jgi:hypothetical protein
MPTGIQSKFTLFSAGNLEQSMGVGHRVGIGLSYRPSLVFVLSFVSCLAIAMTVTKLALLFLGSAKGQEPIIIPIVSYLCGTYVIGLRLNNFYIQYYTP